MNYKESFKQIRALIFGLDPGFLNIYYKYFYKTKANSIGSIIETQANEWPFYFLQIGGNDGYINDPMFKCVKRYDLKGIIVEPQKEVFEKRLSKTYRFEKKVILENVAIADNNENKKLYKLAISDSRWATGLATFDKKTLEHHIENGYVDERAKKEGITIPKNIEDYITHEEVKCSTIESLLQKHHFTHLDLLQIDTEGYDFEIIKTINFNSLRPKIISFESEHLSPEDKLSCQHLLESNGYEVKPNGRDSIAFLK